MESPCTQHGVTLESTCTQCGVTLYNEKLRNLSFDVNFGLPLCTTEYNLTEQNRTEPNLPPRGGDKADGDADQPPAPTQEQEPQTPVPVSKVQKAVKHFWKLLGSPKKYDTKAVGQRWESLIEPKLQCSALEYVTGVMDYALTVNPIWMRSITTVKKMDPMEYFVSKYETIEENREGDEKFNKMKAKRSGKERNPAGYKSTEVQEQI